MCWFGYIWLNNCCWFNDNTDSFLIGYYSLFDSDKNIEWRSFQKNHDLLGAYQNDPMIARLVKLSHNWYTIDKREGKIYFNDLRFGLMGLSPEERRFVFAYELTVKGGVLNEEESEKNTAEAKTLLVTLYNRVLGNK